MQREKIAWLAIQTSTKISSKNLKNFEINIKYDFWRKYRSIRPQSAFGKPCWYSINMNLKLLEESLRRISNNRNATFMQRYLLSHSNMIFHSSFGSSLHHKYSTNLTTFVGPYRIRSYMSETKMRTIRMNFAAAAFNIFSTFCRVRIFCDNFHHISCVWGIELKKNCFTHPFCLKFLRHRLRPFKN